MVTLGHLPSFFFRNLSTSCKQAKHSASPCYVLLVPLGASASQLMCSANPPVMGSERLPGACCLSLCGSDHSGNELSPVGTVLAETRD